MPLGEKYNINRRRIFTNIAYTDGKFMKWPADWQIEKSGRRVRYRRAREYVYGKRVGLSETHGNFRPRERRRDDPGENGAARKKVGFVRGDEWTRELSA